jgi:hypothetical protein
MFLHRTVKDFLEQPDIWTSIISVTNGSSFNPYFALMTSIVMRLKIETMSYGPGNNSFSDVWDVISTAFSFAHEAELRTGQAQIPLLVELKRLAMHHWNIPLAKPENNWVLIIWERLPVVDDHLEEEEMDHALISFAITYGLNQFADHEICQNPSSVMQKSARRWLNLVLDVQGFSVPPNSALISTVEIRRKSK